MVAGGEAGPHHCQGCFVLHRAGKSNLMVVMCFQDPLASYDVNGNDHDPTPRYDASNANRYVMLFAVEPMSVWLGCAGGCWGWVFPPHGVFMVSSR